MDAPDSNRPPDWRPALSPVTALPKRFEALARPLRSADACGLATRFHAWVGCSGRRYVVSVHARGMLPDVAEAVLLAVRRKPDGGMALLGARATDDGLAGWEALAEADEIHVHLLALRPAERRKVVADLTES